MTRVVTAFLAVFALAFAAGISEASPKRDGESTRELVKVLPQHWRIW